MNDDSLVTSFLKGGGPYAVFCGTRWFCCKQSEFAFKQLVGTFLIRLPELDSSIDFSN